jgi:F-type H+-transporting ATPase subunit a
VAEHGHGGGLEHPTWLHFLYAYKILPAWLPEMVPVTWLVILLLSVMVIIASRKLRLRDPGRFQMTLEFAVTSLDGFVRGIVGNEARTLTPIIGSVFIFILTLSLFGLVPGFTSPTANPNTTVSLALLAFLLVQYFGISRLGLRKYLMHFVGDPWWLGGLMVPLHIIGELARPLSLSIRLFGNIFGEETVIAVFVLIVTSVLGNFLVPLQFPMQLFAIFGSFIQALVFSMLVSIYIAVAVAGHEEQH